MWHTANRANVRKNDVGTKTVLLVDIALCVKNGIVLKDNPPIIC